MRKLIAILAAAFVCLLAQAEAAVATIHEMEGNPFGEVRRVPGINPGGQCVLLCGKTLYCGAGSTVYVLDASVPMSPRVVGKVDIVGQPRQMAEQDGYLYVSSRETGAWILDVHEPAMPRIVSHYDALELATGVEVAGDVLFLSMRVNGVEFVDISDKSNPRHITMQKTPESQSLCYRDGILYSGEWGEGKLSVIDASDMSSIKELKTVPLHGYGDGVSLFNDRLFVSTGHHMKRMTPPDGQKASGLGHALEVFDVSEPQNPRFISRTQLDKLGSGFPDFWTARPSADGRLVLCADTYNGLYAVDAEEARVIGRVTFDNEAAKQKLEPCTSVAVGSGVVYATSQNFGLAAVSCVNARPYAEDKGKAPVNPGFRASYDTPSDSRFTAWRPSERVMVRSVATYGDFLYAACSDGGLRILKYMKNGEIQETGSLPAAFAGDVKVRGNRLYVAEGMEGLGIYQIGRAGAELTEMDRVTDFGKKCTKMCLWVWVPTDDFIVVTDRIGPYVFLDAYEYRPVYNFKPATGWDRYTANDVCKGRRLPMFMPYSGLAWLDLSDDRPRQLCRIKGLKTNQRGGVCNYKNGAVAVVGGQLLFLDSGQEKNADGSPLTGVGSGYEGAPMWDGKNLLSVSCRIDRHVTLVDISDTANPVDLWKEKTLGSPEQPIFFKGRLVVPCGYQGLLIQKQL